MPQLVCSCYLKYTAHRTFSHYTLKLITQCSPLKSVDPPDNTMLAKSVRLRSMSDFCMANASTSCIPSHSSPIRSGRNSNSGARNLAGPTWQNNSTYRLYFFIAAHIAQPMLFKRDGNLGSNKES